MLSLFGACYEFEVCPPNLKSILEYIERADGVSRGRPDNVY